MIDFNQRALNERIMHRLPVSANNISEKGLKIEKKNTSEKKHSANYKFLAEPFASKSI